jgi:hypothetical protein
MDSQKLCAALGEQLFAPWPLGEELWPTDREWHHRRAPEQPGSARWLAERLYRYTT